MKRIPIPTVVTAAALVLIFVTYMVTFQVRFSEAAIRVRLGSPGAVIKEPGLYLRWPRPIERVKRYDLRYRVLDTPETEIKTSDGQALIVGCFAIWKIADPVQFYIRVQDERLADDKVRSRINEARATVIGNHSMGSLFNLDSQMVSKSFEQLEQEMLAACRDSILADFGIELSRIGVRRVALPVEATATVQAAMSAELKSRATRFDQGGKSKASAIRARAESDQRKIMAFAGVRAQEIESAGVRASARLLEKIAAGDTEFFLWLRYLEGLKSAFAERSTIFLDHRDVIYRVFSDPSLPTGPGGMLDPELGAEPAHD
jgi:membrane protease subunit HflC